MICFSDLENVELYNILSLWKISFSLIFVNQKYLASYQICFGTLKSAAENCAAIYSMVHCKVRTRSQNFKILISAWNLFQLPLIIYRVEFLSAIKNEMINCYLLSVEL